jgi:hypothetical protein
VGIRQVNIERPKKHKRDNVGKKSKLENKQQVSKARAVEGVKKLAPWVPPTHLSDESNHIPKSSTFTL